MSVLKRPMGCPMGRPPTQPPPRSPVGNAVAHRPDLHWGCAERNAAQLSWRYWVSRSNWPDNERFLLQPREQLIDTQSGVTEVLGRGPVGVLSLLLTTQVELLSFFRGRVGKTGAQRYRDTSVLAPSGPCGWDQPTGCFYHPSPKET